MNHANFYSDAVWINSTTIWLQPSERQSLLLDITGALLKPLKHHSNIVPGDLGWALNWSYMMPRSIIKIPVPEFKSIFGGLHAHIWKLTGRWKITGARTKAPRTETSWTKAPREKRPRLG